MQKTVTKSIRFSVSRVAVVFPRAGENHGPKSILCTAPARVVRFGDADAVEPGEGRHPTSALKK